MRSTLGKRALAKNKPKAGSGHLLDAYDNFDVAEKDDFVDEQYEDLVKNSSNYRKTLAAHDFEDDPKYKGIKSSRKNLYEDNEAEMDMDDESIDSDNVDPDGEDEDLEQEKTEKKKKLLKDTSLNSLLKEINDEDKELISTAKDRNKELQKARVVKKQQAFFDMLIESRVKMQDMLKLANKLPYSQNYSLIKKADTDGEIKRNLKELEVEVLDLVDMLDEVSSSYYSNLDNACLFKPVKRLKKAQEYLKDNNINSKEFVNSYDFDTEALFKTIDDGFNIQVPHIDNIVSNWPQKFNLMSQNSIKGRFMNIFQTPSQQTQKAMEDFDRLVKRTQLRDSKPLFEADDTNIYNEEIFNDEEFYMTIFKEMLQKQAQSGAEGGENDEFLVENTRLYLRNRALRTKNQKDVDRKASKNRKIRFDVHSKLMNFIAPTDNSQLLPGRDQMLKNLFGLYQDIDAKPEEKEKTKVVKGGLKKKGKKTQEAEQEFEINLL